LPFFEDFAFAFAISPSGSVKLLNNRNREAGVPRKIGG
jgi:hypothetical protein